MKPLRVLLLALLCALSFAAMAKEGDGVRARLAKPAVLRGEFAQEKQLHGFRNPLKSSGDFLLLRDRGIAWNTRAPFASSTRLTRKKLLAGDLDALSTRFTLKETLRADGGWSLALQPRDAALKQAFTSIVLDGDRYVRSVEIAEPGGDRTRIRFAGLREAPPATRAEAAQLD